MRRTVFIAVVACGVLAGGAGAQDTVDESLGAFLTRCQTAQKECMSDLSNGYLAAYKGMGEICPPAYLSADAAARREMAWLHNAAAADPALARGKELDAEWTALHTLWPCSD